jgi:glutaredoxin-like protein
MEKLINESIAQQVQEVFVNLQNPVEVLFFGKQDDCEYCPETRQLLEEVATLSDKIAFTAYDIETDEIVARQYKVDKVPGFVIAARVAEMFVDYGVRFAGIPAGHEFTSLIQAIVMVSGRDSGLAQPTRDYLKGLEKPVLLQVFTTPTCPYCPRAVVLAHQMAIESPMVQAEMIDAIEFLELSDRYAVSGVPQTTINDGAAHVVGAVPEQRLLMELRQILETADPAPAS